MFLKISADQTLHFSPYHNYITIRGITNGKAQARTTLALDILPLHLTNEITNRDATRTCVTIRTIWQS
jgi:hypothetical protein